MATGILFPLFVFLGLWQLHRAEEKEHLIALHAERMRAPDSVLGPGEFPAIDAIRFRHVTIEGRYDDAHQVLLDNQVVDHQAGYFVLTPFLPRGGDRVLLINRGWVPAGPARSQLPSVAMTARSKRIRGVADRFPSVGWRLQGAETPTPGWPAVVQVLDAGALSRHLGYPVVPYQVLLDPAEPDGYTRNWRFAPAAPERNRGYALQWFTFATILIVLFIWFGLQPKSAHPR